MLGRKSVEAAESGHHRSLGQFREREEEFGRIAAKNPRSGNDQRP